MTASVVWVSLYLILRNCFQKPRKDVQDERSHSSSEINDIQLIMMTGINNDHNILIINFSNFFTTYIYRKNKDSVNSRCVPVIYQFSHCKECFQVTVIGGK